MAQHPHQVVAKDELMAALWPDSFVEESNLTQHIFLLRKALAENGQGERIIVTVPGKGYQFTAALEPLPSHAEQPRSGELRMSAVQSVTRMVIEAEEEEDAPRPAVLRSTDLHSRRWIWAVVSVGMAVLAVGLVLGWRRFHPTPPLLRISAYTKITHDGHPKSIGGNDQSRIYFQLEDTGDIAEISISGGALSPLHVGLEHPRIGEASPDGSTLLFTSEGIGKGPADSLWTLPVLGGAPRRLGNGISSTWSPDGEKIAYGTANGEICVVRRDGTETRRIASVGGYLKSLAWSPDGSAIRFSSDGLLWEISTDGANLHPLLPGWGKSPTQCCGKWTPQGSFFFVADGQIWLLDERQAPGGHAGQPVALTFGPTVWDRPMPSQDGKKIFASGRTKRGELVRLDARSTQFQPFLAGISVEFVSFSSDGKSVAYVSYPEGVLWQANADGSNPMQLTEPPVYPKSVRWSPDGSQIAFVDRTAQGADAIYIVARDGRGRPRRILPDDLQAETDPSWSPDGHKIAFSTSPNVGASSKSDLRILDLAFGTVSAVPASDGLLVPRWSPDGLLIAAMTLDTMSMKLFNISSGRWTELDTGAVAFPEWSHDGRSIYYVKWTDDPAVIRIRAADGKRETLANLKGVQYTGVYTLWMGLDPADTPMMLRDVGTDDIYSLTLESN
jgi:Tol biopolymer transport system component